MNVIDSYLDTLFAPYPTSPRMRTARQELRAMMEDKQEALIAGGATEAQAVGQVIAEFGSLDEVAETLGIQPELQAAAAEPVDSLPTVDLPRAESFLATVRSQQGLLSAAVPLFVLAAVPLLAIVAFLDPAPGEQAPWPVFLGLGLLLAVVALGVALMVLRAGRLEAFKDITEHRFRPTPEVRRLAESELDRQRPAATRGLVIAIVLWIMSAIPIFIAGALAEDSPLAVLGVVCTLITIAAGLFIYLRTDGAKEQLELLRDGGKDPAQDVYHSENPVLRMIAAVYWPVMVAIYLGWSFLTNDWQFTWVVWPIAGVLFGGLYALNTALSSQSQRAAARR